jgi:hypothetical protein
MRILVEPSDYRFLNAGDAAMTQVAMERLCAFWPSAEILVFTDFPEKLPRFASQVLPLSTRGRTVWRWGLQSARPQSRLLRTAAAMRQWCSRKTPRNRKALAEFLSIVSSADLFVVTGHGRVD